ncbi:MAG: hypothetical protein GY834_15020 [Bacteroidetes bacterium]|nr:hypothetical protein [Bacteroidota bacterium]
MRGDILILDKNHRKAARQSTAFFLDKVKTSNRKFVISVAGESGAGKSEIAAAISDILTKNNISSFIIQQDDYFVYPPKTNAKKRLEDIAWVGMNEVKLDLIKKEISQVLAGETKLIKPLVIFDEDKIVTEEIDLSDIQVLIIEGTYITTINNIDTRIFIDRNYNDTRQSRLKRSREKQDDFLERILLIEHQIISKHKRLADILITKDFNATKSTNNDE